MTKVGFNNSPLEEESKLQRNFGRGSKSKIISNPSPNAMHLRPPSRVGLMFLTAIICILASCTLAPKYKQPSSPVPLEASKLKRSIADVEWREFFISKELHSVIEVALANNRDLKTAVLNIEAARQTHNIKRGDLFPSIGATSSTTRQGVPSTFAAIFPKRQYRAGLSLASFELDFFGRLRSLKKAAYEDFLASKEAKNVIEISLIAEVANSYIQLLADQESLAFMDYRLREQKKKYELMEARYKAGIASLSEWILAQTDYENEKIAQSSYVKLVEQDMNALMLLMGVYDEKLIPQARLQDIKVNEELLELVPSETLLSRPDIRQAEHELKAANSNIGAARAAFFPSITLTGNYGYASRDAASLFDSKLWTYTPQVNLPIFNGGKNIANLKLANIQKNVYVIAYEKAIQTAFREVLDELANRQASFQQFKSSEEIWRLTQKAYEVAQKRFANGTDSALTLATSHLNFLTSQQNLSVNNKLYLATLIDLYKVMGGGSNKFEE